MRWWVTIALMAVSVANGVRAQQVFELDTTFRTAFEARNIVDALVLPDGDVVVSGALRYADDQIDLLRGGIRLNPDGSRDLDFPEVAYMGAHLIPWQDKLYAGNGAAMRRSFISDFSQDLAFNTFVDPLFSSFQYGQYHVFPDGRVLMTGIHDLDDPVRGFVGSYELVWLTNTGRLDTTRIHRNTNGYLRTLKQTYDGKFMCWGSGTLFDGHAVPRVFRVHADGSWDSSFVAPFVPYTGYCFGFLPLPDGRCYAAGQFFVQGDSDTLNLVRFLPDGSLDPTFNNHITFEQSAVINSSGALLGGITQATDDRFFVYGNFDHVDGQFSRGICMIDSAGVVQHQYFDGTGCGVANYNGSMGNSIEGMAPAGEGKWYVWGFYDGYDDGTINDPEQRLISRLIAPDLSTALPAEVPPARTPRCTLAPNPATTWVQVSYDLHVLPTDAALEVRDLTGRTLLRKPLQQAADVVLLDTRSFASGTYLVELTTQGRSLGANQKLVVAD